MHKHGVTTLRVLSAYLVLTLVMTWPTAPHLTTAIPGDGFDGWQNYWNLWWVRQALLVEGTNPYHTGYLYPPDGASLLFHTLNIFNGLWTLPLQLNAGLAVAYNSVVFFSFTLAGYGSYLLALHVLTRLGFTQNSRLAAFVAGVIFTMSPFHMAHLLGHMQVFSLLWIPFYLLYLLRAIEPHAPPRTIGMACLFLILVTSVSYYHTVYVLLFTVLLVAWTVTQRFIQRQPLAHTVRPVWTTGLIGLGFGLVMSPLLVALVGAASQRPDLETGLAQNITLSADLLGFVLPSELHPWWGTWTQPIANNFTTTTSERLVFLGFVPLTLALSAVIRYRQRAWVWFWAVTAGFFVILALGPQLHIYGQPVRLNGSIVPMPYLLLYDSIPFLSLTRSLSRYTLMVMLALSILTAISLTRWPQYVSLLALGLICFEFWVVPYPISEIQIPAFYDDLAQQSDDFNIAELPMTWDRPTTLLHQTVHGKPLLTAYTSRSQAGELARRVPVFQQWRTLQPDIIDVDLARVAPTIMADFNLRYVVLDYWQMPPGPERDQTESWVRAALPDIAPVYDDGRLKVYQAPPFETKQSYLTLGHGWQPLTEAGRTIDSTAELWLNHPQAATNLDITATAAVTSTLRLTLDDETIAQWHVSDTPSTHVVIVPPIAAERSRLTLHSNRTVVIVRVGLAP